MRKILSYVFVLFSLFLLLSGCGERRPKGVLSKGKMENVLYDYHIARSMADNLPPNESYKQRYYVEGVFRKYGISETDFYSSMAWYSRHTEEMSDIYQDIQKRLKLNIDKINKLISDTQHNPKGAASGDSINIWTFLHTSRLTGDNFHYKLAFSIMADTTFHARDAFEWSVTFIKTDMVHAGLMVLSVHYMNDSTITQNVQIQGSGFRVLRVQNNMPVQIRDVDGFIYYPKGSGGVLVVKVKSLMRYHTQGSVLMPSQNVSSPNVNIPSAVHPIPANSNGALHSTIPVVSNKSNVSISKTDTAKSLIISGHRYTPEELNKKRTDLSTPHGYQIRQQEIEKQMQDKLHKGFGKNNK